MLVIVDKNFDIERVDEKIQDEVSLSIRSFATLLTRLRVTVGVFILNKIVILANAFILFSIFGLHVFPFLILALMVFFDIRYVWNKIQDAYPISRIYYKSNRSKLPWMLKSPILILSTEQIDLLNDALPKDKIFFLGKTDYRHHRLSFDDDIVFHVYAVKDSRTAMLVKLAH